MSLNSTEGGYVNLQTDNGIGTINFFHPSHNSMPGYQLRALANTITQAGNDDSIKVIILRSAGDKTFCAGASFDELINIKNIDEGRIFFSGFANVINAMRTCPKFIIGRVQGKAVGGGVGIAAAVDYCFATKAASVKLSELAVGIGPFVVGPAVVRKIGISAMSQLSIDATSFYSADWALGKGLYAGIYETADEMDTAIHALADRLVQSNPEAMKSLKQICWEGTENWDILLANRAEISGTLVLSDFTRNAIEKFKAK